MRTMARESQITSPGSYSRRYNQALSLLRPYRHADGGLPIDREFIGGLTVPELDALAVVWGVETDDASEDVLRSALIVFAEDDKALRIKDVKLAAHRVGVKLSKARFARLQRLDSSQIEEVNAQIEALGSTLELFLGPRGRRR